MWIAVGKQCALPGGIFFTVKQFDICCCRSVMRGLLQLSFELRRSFCINLVIGPYNYQLDMRSAVLNVGLSCIAVDVLW